MLTRAMLDIFIDFKSPAAYLALKPTRALLQEENIEARFRPFRMRDRDVPQIAEHETVGDTHRRVRAASRRKIFLHYAAVQGIEMNFPTERTPTDLALGALALIDGPQLPFIEACFVAYWRDNADLDDAAIVARLIADSGVTLSDDLAQARAALETALEAAEEDGAVDTPGYLVKEQMFVGREHLPWVRELLQS